MLPVLPETKSSRVQRIRSRLIGNPPGICAERLRYYTEAYQQHAAEPIIIRRALALKNYLEHVTLYFDADTLIPGELTSHPRTAAIFPEYSWTWIYDELDRFDRRTYDRFTISDEVKAEARRLLPWWENRSVYERVLKTEPEEVLRSSEVGVMSWTGQATSGEGHIVVDYPTILATGFENLRERARRLRGELPLYEPDSLSKREFYRAVEIVCDGVLNYAARLADFINARAQDETDAGRREEMLSTAACLRSVPAEPAQTFRQAIITVWLVHMIEQMESNGHSVSLGRFDQYVYPYFEKDIQAGRINEEQALELIEHFYLKLFSVIKLRPEKHSRTQSGYPMYQNLVVGGQTRQGEDASNRLSLLCLAALAEVRLSEPNFYIRLHKGTPEDFLRAALRVVRLDFGMPAFVNDEIIVESLERRGVSHADALDYSTMGCLEVQVPGKWSYRANGKSKVNALKVMELALNDGKDPLTGLQLHAGSGDMSGFSSFEDVLHAWRQQMEYYTRLHVTADNIIDYALEEMVPNAYCSMLVQDCLGRGKHLNQGGAIYDMTSGALVGVPNVGNTLAALRKLVYDEHALSADEIRQALADNFAGPRGEEIRQVLLNRAPKYGEDNDYADQLTAMALNDYCEYIINFKDMRHGRGPIGGTYYPSTVTISANITAGDAVGATPDGRKAHEPTADGVSPAQSTGKKGPTAILQSVGKLPTVLVTGGQLLNLRLTHNSLSSEQGIAKLAGLMRGFIDLRAWHVQFNTVSTETLKDAIEHPENYKDLIVRVAGYSALFVALDPVLQRDIIARMEHELV
ncbi:MAG: formate C-acetyltransferase/glycerol dehydratase family glycyl radical enzyme [Anaerolineaceae bacterium]|nr:formate C-acetyltransferase/glycerol dehydratase family glycyl radical enzyme [Anaerolineaceae bacterium]